MSSETGSSRPTFLSYRCDCCGKYPIQDFRWECTVCDDYDMCNNCYIDGKHIGSHRCERYAIQSRKIATPDVSTKSALLPESKIRGIYDSIRRPRKKIKALHESLFLSIFEAGVQKWPKERNMPAAMKKFLVYNTEKLLGYDVTNDDNSLGTNELPQDYDTVLLIITCMHAQITFWESGQLEWFGTPVPAATKGYYDVIKEASDLGTILAFLERGRMLLHAEKTPMNLVKEYCRRLELVWLNAMVFNPKEHSAHVAAKKLRLTCINIVLNCLRHIKSCQLVLETPDGYKQFWKESPENLKLDVHLRPKGAPRKGKETKKQGERGGKTTGYKRKAGTALAVSKDKPKAIPKAPDKPVKDEMAEITVLQADVSDVSKGVAALHEKLDKLSNFVDIFSGS